jgi:hypothetical protein
LARACASKTPTTSSSWARSVAYTSGAFSARSSANRPRYLCEQINQ